jgi:hypothetical protein
MMMIIIIVMVIPNVVGTIREVSGSNFSSEIGLPEIFHGFSEYVKEDADIKP